MQRPGFIVHGIKIKRQRTFASTCDAAIPMHELHEHSNPHHLRLRTREPQEQSQSPPSRLFDVSPRARSGFNV